MKKMFVNETICAGCRYCEIMCSLAHSKNSEVNPRKSRIRIKSDPKNGIDVPNVCRQCPEPQCMAACVSGAISINAVIGNMEIDYDKCIGCMQCVTACPFSAVMVDVDTSLPIICDLCGGEPNCIKHCRILAHIGVRTLNYK